MMSNGTPSPKPNIFKSLIIAIIVLAVIVALIAGLGALRLPAWPFIFFLFYFSSVVHMAADKLIISAAGGLIGLTASFSQGLITAATGSATVGLAVFLLFVIALITLMVDGRLKYVDTLCMLFLTCLTNFPGLTPPEQYLPALASFLLSVAVFAVLLKLMANAAAKKAGQSG